MLSSALDSSSICLIISPINVFRAESDTCSGILRTTLSPTFLSVPGVPVLAVPASLAGLASQSLNTVVCKAENFMTMMDWKDVELEVKITLVAVVYTVFKLIEDHLGILPGSPIYESFVNACRAIFVGSHLWLHLQYASQIEEINRKESLSAMSKLQRRKSLKETMRWIYLRAVTVGAVHVFYMRMLPVLICTPLLAYLLLIQA